MFHGTFDERLGTSPDRTGHACFVLLETRSFRSPLLSSTHTFFLLSLSQTKITVKGWYVPLLLPFHSSSCFLVDDTDLLDIATTTAGHQERGKNSPYILLPWMQ